MDLNQILQKTKKRAGNLNASRRAPPSIAIQDRPYEPTAVSQKPQTNRKQTGNKQLTNREQNRKQTANKPGTDPQAKIIYQEQTGNKPGSESGTLSGTNREQTGNSPDSAIFNNLVGLQRKIILVIYKVSQLNRSDVTGPLSLEMIANQIGKVSIHTIKTSLKRLELKSCIHRVTFKPGRGGWSTYKLAESLFNEIIQEESSGRLLQFAALNAPNTNQNREQTGNKPESESGTQPLSSSSNDYNYKNTTTTNELPAEYTEINFGSLAGIGFTKSHLLQIVRRTILTPGQVQDSIDAFAFDLEKNNKQQSFQKPPLDVFMGILGKGLVYNAPENFETPQQANMKRYLEQKRAEIEKKKQLEEEALSIAFEEWKDDSSNSSLVNDLIQQMEPMIRMNASVVDGQLFTYYKEQVWPTEKQEFLCNIGRVN